MTGENNKKYMNTKTQVALVVIASFIAWVMYQNMVALPEAKLAQEKKVIQDKQISYDACLRKALIDYSSNWDSQCSANNKVSNCTLSKFIADDVEKSWAEDKKNCVTMYK